MGFFTKYLALFRAKKEEEKHIVTDQELKEEDKEFKEEEKELRGMLITGNNRQNSVSGKKKPAYKAGKKGKETGYSRRKRKNG